MLQLQAVVAARRLRGRWLARLWAGLRCPHLRLQGMSEVRDREKAAKQAELFASEQRAKSFLQQQQADARSGGQGGMWKKKKK